MVNSYDNLMGDEQDPGDHPAHNVPQASQHYAGDVLPMPGESSMGPGPTPKSADYGWGNKESPNVVSIGKPTMSNWLKRAGDRARTGQ